MAESTTEQSPAIHLDVWFDVRCPWCFLGTRRLRRAIELFAETEPGIPVTVRHHSFELAPGIPERFAGGEADYLLRYEGVPLEQSARTIPALQQLAAEEGVELRFGELQQVNTRPAHRVFQYARAEDRGEEALDRLFTAYFSECRDLADADTLAELAVEAGLDRTRALAAAIGPVVAGEGGPTGAGAYLAEAGAWDRAVEKDDVRARMLGAQGVPYTLVNAKYSISGAQPLDILLGALREVVRRDFPGHRVEGADGDPGDPTQ